MTVVTDKFGRPLHDLRISVTDRCNFRCAYCMPAEVFGHAYRFLPKNDLLTFEEIARIARILAGMGVVKLRITGGEPLIRQDLPKLIGMLKAIDGIEDIALTTNGVLLPQHARALRDAGLDRVTVSLDTLDDAVFRKMNGDRASVQRVLDGIAAAENVGFAPIKLNSVVQRGVNDHTLVELAHFARERGYILRFIEYMDVGTLNGWRLDDVVPAAEIIERVSAEIPLTPLDSNYDGEVAKRFGFADGSGEIGLITSVTQPFCGACSRLRMSPEGELFTCLFGTQGFDLRAPIRDGADDAALTVMLSDLWGKRADRYSELRASMTRRPSEKVEMYHIGG